MEIESLSLPEVLLISPRVLADERGRFVETWSERRSMEVGLPTAFRQDNVSFSKRGVLRGLHCQHPNGQGKLVTVLRGHVFDVVVDVRVGSPRFGQWEGVGLDDVKLQQLYVPAGFLHGFVTMSDNTVFSYKCTEFYEPTQEFCVRWNDPALGVEWPVVLPTLSAKDAGAPLLADIPHKRLPLYSSSSAVV
jgi:dTDP-4-dehydrorhamnose 3,5-epimerase